jgi:hypothetical protein
MSEGFLDSSLTKDFVGQVSIWSNAARRPACDGGCSRLRAVQTLASLSRRTVMVIDRLAAQTFYHSAVRSIT